MKLFQCDPQIEISGTTLLPMIDNLQAENIRPILERHQMTDIQPDQWYPISKWLNVFKDIYENYGGMWDLVSIGMRATEIVLQAQETPVMPLAQFLQVMLPQLYTAQFRNGVPGYVRVEQPAEKHLIVVLNTPFPPDATYGALYGFARSLLPRGTAFVVEYDPATPPGYDGDDPVKIHVKWE